MGRQAGTESTIMSDPPDAPIKQSSLQPTGPAAPDPLIASAQLARPGLPTQSAVLDDQRADLQHVIRVTGQMLSGIESALAHLKGNDRRRLERQRRLLTREYEVTLTELARLDLDDSHW
ncbi:MAG: hypothetical protein AVDCRST_MAG33-1503 [uncultured Thermomicrobiales bacterium]|uniref:Uncharacterized protein n=1 Tax=uncultured Thermomicrobiales bacterium TaxID=1645740 RepID=A0A6J4US24_9BACT|nr:MAG: hypothetical protein AVDCRST_MAG33-1503 [uncultured Thermomicrobiales bacterium]